MQRPISVTVFGILNIVFAALGVLGLVITLAMFSASASSNNPVFKAMQESPAFMFWMKLTIPLGLITSGALLAAGIGLLLLKPWARILSVVYAIYSIVFGLIGVVVNFFVLVRPMMQAAAEKQGPESAGLVGGAIGGSVGGCFGMIYPILLLIFMLRPNVKNAFRPADTPSPPSG